mgnify:CR=1 FL=1
MIDDERVIIHARSAAAVKLARTMDGPRIADYFVVSAADWIKFTTDAATRVMLPVEHAAHAAIWYMGQADEGVWLRGVGQPAREESKKFVAILGGRVPFMFVSKNGYEILRAKYFKWWSKCSEQAGWGVIPPSPILWRDSNAPRPAEMRAYKELLVARFDGQEAEIARRAKRCDPSHKLLDLAKAKAKASR